MILHTWGIKQRGLLLFAAPLFFYGYEGILPALFVIAKLSAAEEVLIHLAAKELDRDQRELFFSRFTRLHATLLRRNACRQQPPK